MCGEMTGKGRSLAHLVERDRNGRIGWHKTIGGIETKRAQAARAASSNSSLPAASDGVAANVMVLAVRHLPREDGSVLYEKMTESAESHTMKGEQEPTSPM